VVRVRQYGERISLRERPGIADSHGVTFRRSAPFLKDRSVVPSGIKRRNLPSWIRDLELPCRSVRANI
jgi:hypothetical protein